MPTIDELLAELRQRKEAINKRIQVLEQAKLHSRRSQQITRHRSLSFCELETFKPAASYQLAIYRTHRRRLGW